MLMSKNVNNDVSKDSPILMNLISFQKQYGPKATYSAAKTLQRLFGPSQCRSKCNISGGHASAGGVSH